jgi:Flp pilus assembly protein TadG
MVMRGLNGGCRRSARRRGLSVVLVVLILVVLVAFASLAVDFGRVWLARAEMQTVADAAAASGALALPVSQGEVENRAVETASRNPVIDTEKSDADHLGMRTNPGVALEVEEDLAVGIWDPSARTFTELSDDASTPNRDERRMANAVLAVGKRNSERESALPLILAPVLGVFDSDIERPATAYVTSGAKNFGFIGLDWVRADGNDAAIDGPDGLTSDANGGGVASNGDIDLRNADVWGDVRPGIDQDIITRPNTTITGWAADLDYVLDYPPQTFNKPATNDNAVISSTFLDGTRFVVKSGSVTLPSGTYYFKNTGNKPAWEMSGNANVTITAPATVYVDGDFIMGGNTTLRLTPAGKLVSFYVNGDFKQNGGNIITPGTASDLYVSVTKAGSTVNIGGNPETQMHLYAPVSDVTVNGTPDFSGWIVGKTLRFLGTSKLHYDGTGNDTTPFTIQLVK